MSASVALTVLVENRADRRGLAAEHGLAVALRAGSRFILFDTGQTGLVGANAARLGVDLRAIDTVVLSHGHYDHCGGLPAVLDGADREIAVFAHPHVLQPKYHQTPAGLKEIGIPVDSLRSLRQRSHSLRLVAAPVEIAPGVFLTGEVPRVHPEEGGDGGFRSDASGRTVDRLLDDQALFVPTPVGTIVLLGCAHAGAINTLDHILRLTEGRPIRLLMGGMHLGAVPEERLAWTLAALQRRPVERLYPAHCTGAKATAALWAAFPDRCFPCPVGTTWSVE